MKKLSAVLVLILFVVEVKAQADLIAINEPYEQNFNSLPSSGTANEATSLPAGWTFTETGSNADTQYAAGTGSSATGNTYSFGSGASSDRAFGGLLSGSLNPTIGVSFVNNTGATITSFQISYWGEQWRLGALNRGQDRLNFQYSLNAASLNSGTWTDVDELDFPSLITSGTVGSKDGNDPLNRVMISFVVEGLAIEDGSTFYFRWQDFNVSNADDGLAIDDFVLIPAGIPSTLPAIAFSAGALHFGDVVINTSDTLTYRVTGSNLEEPIETFVSAGSPFRLSVDGSSFSSSIILPDTGAIVYVIFIPVVDGLISDSILHSSGSVTEVLSIEGNGFEQASHIIPIMAARSRPVGEIVTVAGRITVANELANPAYLQDDTGGIPVFDFNLAANTSIGDSVIVTGPVGIFMDQKQISGAEIFFTKPDDSKRMILPELIDIDELVAHEGMLVTVQGVELVNKNFVFYPQSTEQISAGGVVADLRIDGDTDIPGLTKPQGTADITGVVGRFRTNTQLLPRFRTDIPGSSDPTTPSDSIPKHATFDVVTWNLEFFGAKSEDYDGEEYGPADESLQLENVKRVLDVLDADIIAAEEVSDDSAFAALVSRLGNYSFICSERYSYSFEGPDDEFPPQKLCFIYDTATVKIISARPMFEGLYDSARTTDPSRLPGYPSGDPGNFFSSGRLPYMLTVNATINGATEQISLIAIHAKSGASAGDHNRRQYDATVLKDSLDTHYPSEQIIILGDLNDDLDQSIASGLASPYESFVNDTGDYLAVTKTLSDAGARSTTSFQDVIDHQIIANDLQEEYLAGSAQIITPFRLIDNYANTTSDHLPVITRYTWDAPVISFAQSAVRLNEDSSIYVVEITLSEPLATAKEVSVTISGEATYGADFYTVAAADRNLLVLAIPAGVTNISFAVHVIDDEADELPEQAIFTIHAPDGLTEGQPTFTLTLEDNDIPSVSFASFYAYGEEGSGEHTIKMKLSTPPASDQSVAIEVYNGPGAVYGDDYVTSPEPDGRAIGLLIPAGSAEAEFIITPQADTRRELPLELVTFFLSGTSSGLNMGTPASRVSAFFIIDVKKRHPRFIVTPNPTNGVVQISCGELEPGKILQAELRNPDGAQVYAGGGTLAAISIAVSQKLQHGRRGVYSLTLFADGQAYVVRVVRI